MGKLLKGFLLVILIIILLALAGIAFLIFSVNPEQYKSKIIQQFESTTGRTLSINGKIQWMLFPHLGFIANNIHIGNPKNFAQTDFLSANTAKISVDVMPLLEGNIKLGKLSVDNLKVNLIKNSQNDVNWRHWSISNKSISSSTNTPTTNSSASLNTTLINTDQKNHLLSYFKFTAATISAINFQNAQINYTDEAQKKIIQLNNLNFNAKDIGLNKEFPISLTTIITTNKIKQPLKIQLTGDAFFNLNIFKLNNINMTTNQYHWQGNIQSAVSPKNLSSLNGKLTVSGNNGALKGIDLFYYGDLANAFINHTLPTRQNTKQTPFGNLHATLTIQNGIINNDDLVIESPELRATGKGNINLVNQKINFTLLLERLNLNSQVVITANSLPIMITGPLSDPKIDIYWEKLMNKAIGSEIKNALKKDGSHIQAEINRGIQSLIGR